MFRKIRKTWTWFKRFLKTSAKYPVFREEVWPRYWDLVSKERLYKVFVSSLLCILATIVFALCLVDLIGRHAVIMPWVTLIFIAIAVWKLVANLMRLSQPLKTAADQAVEVVREARGDYLDDDDEEEEAAAERAARRQVQHASRRRNNSAH